MHANRDRLCDGAEWADLKVEFETFPAGRPAPLLAGFPTTPTCPHWGSCSSAASWCTTADHPVAARR